MTFQMPAEKSELDVTANIYRALKALELVVMQPAVEADSVFMGYANDMALPEGSNEYVINTILSHVEHGTPITRYELNAETGAYETRIRKLEEVVLQVDAYSDDPEAARMRIECLAALSRTPLGYDFMRRFGVSSLYADPPRNATLVVDAEKYVHRWTTNLHLAYTHVMTLNADGFGALDVGVHNVDSRLPPV